MTNLINDPRMQREGDLLQNNQIFKTEAKLNCKNMRQSDSSSRIRTPQFVVAACTLIICGLGYYFLTYSWENADLVRKYTSTMARLERVVKTNEDLDKAKKFCDAKLISFERSNNELQSRISEKENELAEVIQEKEGMTRKLKNSNEFYISVKDILGKLDDPNFEDFDGTNPQSNYNALKDVLKDWQIKLKDCDASQESQVQSTQKLSELRSELEQEKKLSQNYIEENKSMKEKMTSLEEQLDKLENEKNLRGIKSGGNMFNVKQENFNPRQSVVQPERHIAPEQHIQPDDTKKTYIPQIKTEQHVPNAMETKTNGIVSINITDVKVDNVSKNEQVLQKHNDIDSSSKYMVVNTSSQVTIPQNDVANNDELEDTPGELEHPYRGRDDNQYVGEQSNGRHDNLHEDEDHNEHPRAIHNPLNDHPSKEITFDELRKSNLTHGTDARIDYRGLDTI